MVSSVSNDHLQDILQRSHDYLKQCGLRPFLLKLPLVGASAVSNQQGIREKILKNRSYIATPYNPPDGATRNLPDSVTYMEQVCERLLAEDIVGFVLIVAEFLGQDSDIYETEEERVSNSAYQYRPVAGGVVELLDEHERAVRGLWCRRTLSGEVSDSLLKVTAMRLLAHAFDWQHPNNPTKKVNSKLVSTLEIHSVAFPRETYNFFTTPAGLNLSKHWETPEDGGAHNDSPLQRCKCFKLAEKSDAWQFWGISESRFIKAWLARKDTLIPIDTPASVTEEFKTIRRFDAKRGIETRINGESKKMKT